MDRDLSKMNKWQDCVQRPMQMAIAMEHNFMRSPDADARVKSALAEMRCVDEIAAKLQCAEDAWQEQVVRPLYRMAVNNGATISLASEVEMRQPYSPLCIMYPHRYRIPATLRFDELDAAYERIGLRTRIVHNTPCATDFQIHDPNVPLITPHTLCVTADAGHYRDPNAIISTRLQIDSKNMRHHLVAIAHFFPSGDAYMWIDSTPLDTPVPVSISLLPAHLPATPACPQNMSELRGIEMLEQHASRLALSGTDSSLLNE